MDVTIYYNVCATTSYMQLLLAKWISYYSSATYEWQNRYNDKWLFLTTQINNKSSQTINWFKYLLMIARFFRGRGVGGGFIKNWSEQSACTAEANEVATIFCLYFLLYLYIFLLLLLILPERIVGGAWNFACTPK